MPFAPCPECGQVISDSAPTCPFCGRSNEGPPQITYYRSKLIAIFSTISVLMMLGGGVALYFFQPQKANEREKLLSKSLAEYQSQQNESAGFTDENFAKIKPGMSYDQVIAILGQPNGPGKTSEDRNTLIYMRPSQVQGKQLHICTILLNNDQVTMSTCVDG